MEVSLKGPRRKKQLEIPQGSNTDNYTRLVEQGFQKGHTKFRPKSDRWAENTEEAFYNWMEDVQPHVLTRSGRWAPFSPTDEQKELISAVFEKDDQGRLLHQVCLSIMPRRHGKSTVWALIVLFFHMSRENFNICLLGNSDQHVMRVMFARLKSIIIHSPRIKARIDIDKDILQDRIRDEKRNSHIFRTWVSMSGAFGDRINLLWVSDFHASPDIDPFNALQASLLDSEDSIILIDSNADHTGGHVHGLEQQALEDDSIFCRHVEYGSFTEFCVYAPEWIDRRGAERLQKTALEADFKRDILGQRSSETNSLFSPDVIQSCINHYRMPVDDVKALANGRPYKIGGGLDRAKNLIAGASGDHTVWTTIMKSVNPDGEYVIDILNQIQFTINSSRAIKEQIISDHKKYHLDNVTLENFEVADLQPWIAGQGIPVEIVHPNEGTQNIIFPELHRLAKQGRLHIPANNKGLPEEMSTFIYRVKKSLSSYWFGHSSNQFHDDRVYSLAWAVYSLRDQILSPYKISCISCHNRQAHKRALCVLMGGTFSLMCGHQCDGYQELVRLYRCYRQEKPEDDITIEEFFKGYVRTQDCVRTWQEL